MGKRKSNVFVRNNFKTCLKSSIHSMKEFLPKEYGKKKEIEKKIKEVNYLLAASPYIHKVVELLRLTKYNQSYGTKRCLFL